MHLAKAARNTLVALIAGLLACCLWRPVKCRRSGLE